MSTVAAGAGSLTSGFKTVIIMPMPLSIPEAVRHCTNDSLTQCVLRHAVDPIRTRLLTKADVMNNDTSVFDVVGTRAAALVKLIGARLVGIVTLDMVSTPAEEASSVDMRMDGEKDTGILNHTEFLW